MPCTSSKGMGFYSHSLLFIKVIIMIKMTCYNYQGKPNTLYKHLENGYEMDINFNMDFDLINPILKITTNAFPYNYVKLGDLGYYFVSSKSFERSFMLRLRLEIDVLMTYQDTISQLKGTITGTRKYGYLQGQNVPIDSRQKVITYDFPNTPFTDNSDNYIMIAIGGGVDNG